MSTTDLPMLGSKKQSTKYQGSFELKYLPKIISNGSKGSWRAAWAEAKRCHLYVADAITIHRLRPATPLEKAKLILTRYSSSEPDSDNLYSSFKHIVDGLVKAHVLINDKPSNVGIPEIYWVKCKPKQGKIRIEIYEL